ncbi:DUF2771 family protein [Amycolatopsis australiensis]|uniref:DUF2771 family protein n=1 Tax=Amycolatopsis australiensis TaxID=546364 RepID=A0A1K1QPW8_9PSEU|nr:DUF2771 family protein [Amycolatopsis australiensis]SFW62002.1 Protein of unknown function [Amycolatopsis australiensis]
MRRSRVVALLAAGGFAVAGCSAPGPAEVTFYADGHTISSTPVLKCDYSQKLEKPCQAVGAPETLKVRAGKPVQISVPGEVADAPWQIVFEYVTPQGEFKQSEPIPFTSLDRYAYTVTPPTPADRISAVDVQKFTAVLNTGTGESGLLPSDVWGLQLEG